jgi:hypothetical protein
MSNALAVATVTQALARRVTGCLAGSLVGTPAVSTLRPDDASLQGAEASGKVNIFLYQVTPNAAFRNADLPTRRADGSTAQRPQLALDLHYLITFYGSDSTLEHQRLLGATAINLHAYPALTRAEIELVEATQEPTTQQLYLGSSLSQQGELVRFTPVAFSLDDISKLWSAFPQTDFVLSLAYLASVVLIQTDDPPPGPALPVLKRRVQAIPFSLSVITAVVPQSLPASSSPAATIGLIGQGLAANGTAVFMTPGTDGPVPGPVTAGGTSQMVSVALPAGLRAGINSVQLVQTVAGPPGTPATASLQSSSNSMTFVLLPTVVSVSAAGGVLTAVVSPAVGIGQQVSLVLNQQGGAAAYTLPADPHTTQTGTFTFGTTFTSSAPPAGPATVPAGTYLVRVQVDSAESQLTVNAAGQFGGPLVTL